MPTADIRARVIEDYGPTQLDHIEAMFAEYDGPEVDRILRCILHLARGEFWRLEHNLSVARTDYRDVNLLGRVRRGRHPRSQLHGRLLIERSR